MNHVGRDIGVQFIHESEEGGLDYNVGAYYNNSSTFAAAARVSSDEAVVPVGIAVSSVFQRLKLDKNVPISTVLGNLSFFQHAERFSWNAEGFVGIDPFASRFRQLAAGSNDEKVWLAGGKASGSYYFSIGDGHHGIEPVIVFGYLAPDTRNFKVYTLEVLIGVNCYLNKDTRARVNVHPLLSKNGIDKEFSQVGSTVSLEFQVRW
jgi:hypothetical protein